MSEDSPGPVLNNEVLTRVVLENFANKKRDNVLPSLFARVATDGCSVQREGFATNAELASSVAAQLRGKPISSWVAVVTASCKRIREITLDGNLARCFCVYDVSELGNPAHAEICAARMTFEADQNELRSVVRSAFMENGIQSAVSYRQSAVLAELDRIAGR